MNNQEMTAIQLAAAYAAYEIIGSLFYKCQFKNPFEEQRLKMYFLSKKEEKQYDLEDRILAFVDKHLVTNTDLACEVTHYEDKGKYVLVFQTYFSSFCIAIKQNGWPISVKEAV